LTRLSAAARAPDAADALEPSRDGELLRRVARGDVAALRVLYDQHAPRAMAIALRVLRNQQEAEDVVQETFLELWRRSAQFDAGRADAAAFIATITYSRAIDRQRASATAGRARQRVATEDRSAAFMSPAEQAQERRDAVRVATALRTLPSKQREIIELAYFEGLSQREIAAKTGSPLGTVKTRVKLAIDKLARLLKD
jgi:RNA polymerase sigma-70 factor (ECF subfamily)